MDVSIVIPAYRSEKTLPELVGRLDKALKSYQINYEIVIVDDGSPDDTWAVISRLQKVYSDRIVAVQLMRNFGQHNATMCGFRHAKGRFIVTMDDDLQNPPEEVPKLIDAAREGNLDVIYGHPASRKQDRWRNLGSSLVRKFYQLIFHSRANPSPFRILSREISQKILNYDLNFTYVDGLLAWTTQRVGEIEVEHHQRPSGRSGYSAGKLATLALNLFTNFSLLPLQVISMLGLLTAFGGFLGGFYYLIAYLTSQITVPGYASMIIAILIMGGAQLLALGVIGEYLGRLHLNVNKKPQYIVRQVSDRTVSLPNERVAA